MKILVALLAALLGFALLAPSAARAETAYAAVSLNGARSGTVIELEIERDAILAEGGDLDELGLIAPAGRVALGDLPGVSARFDVRTQTLALVAAPQALKSQALTARGRASPAPDPVAVDRPPGAAWSTTPCTASSARASEHGFRPMARRGCSGRWGCSPPASCPRPRAEGSAGWTRA